MANAKLQGCSAELQCLPYGNVERQCLLYGPQLMNTLLVPAKMPNPTPVDCKSVDIAERYYCKEDNK